MRSFNKILLLVSLIFLQLNVFAGMDINLKTELGYMWADPVANDTLRLLPQEHFSNDHLSYATQDFVVRGPGRASELDLHLTRVYRNNLNQQGIFGSGWHSNLDISLDIVEDIYVVTDEIGEVFTFFIEDGVIFPLSRPNTNRFFRVGGTQFIFQKKYGNQYYFNSETLILEYILDRNGNKITYTRNETNQVISLSDSAGRNIDFVYDETGHLTNVQDPLNRINHYNYNMNGDLDKVTDVMGGITQFEYNDPLDIHNITKITNPNNHSQYFEYDSNDRLTRILDNEEEVLKISYLENPPIITRESASGLRQIFEYDYEGDRIIVTDQFGTETNVYDYFKFLVNYEDRLGNQTIMSRDSWGDVLSVTNARNVTTETDYENHFHRPQEVRSPLSMNQFFKYDSKGNFY